MVKASPTTNARVLTQSPKQDITSPNRSNVQAEAPLKTEPNAGNEQSKPLAPPPRPGQQAGNTPDYFSNQPGGDSLSLEPNPFEQSFGVSGPPDTPNGTKLPSVAALTSPSSLLPGNSNTPFNWGGGSLRAGPLSPAMLSAPTNDYFSETHLRGGFPTPNESSLRTGLTPGGSGSMFPAASPNTSAVFGQLQPGGATPGTLDFHRTAMAAAASKREQRAQQTSHQTSGAPPLAPTSAPSLAQDLPPVTSAPQAHKTESKTFDQDSNAANSLFLLAQGRGSAQPQAPYVAPPPPATAAPSMRATDVPIPLPPAASVLPPASAMPHQTPVPIPTIPGAPSMQHGRMVNGATAMPDSGTAVRAGSKLSMGGASQSGSETGSGASDDNGPARPQARGRGKRRSSGDTGTSATNGRRKMQDTVSKNGPASKKVKTSSVAIMPDDNMDMDSQSDDDDTKPGKDGQPRQKMTDEEKRKNFLERNRVAALKCRQRKKMWLQNLQTKVELYSTENENLSSQINQLREEVVNLKTLLLAHKDCPITQQQGLHGSTYMQQSIEPFNPQQINPYGMGAPISGQPVIAGQHLDLLEPSETMRLVQIPM